MFFCARKEVHIIVYVSIYVLTAPARYSILPGLSLSSVLYLNIVTSCFDSQTFAEFIDILLTQMNPFPGPNSVIVMDNCRIHKLPFILDMIEQRYVHTLVPYP